MLNRNFAAAVFLAVLAGPVLGQQGGTFTPDTSPTPGADAGGPVGTQAIPRPDNAVTNSVKKHGQDCEKMTGTVSGERPATAGANEPQPQEKCERH